MSRHTCTLKCVRAENHIAELGIQVMAFKGKLRKKNIKIQELEVINKKLRMPVTTHEIVGALARGYCSKENEEKALDPDLVNAQAKEISAMLKSRTEPKGE